MAPGARTKVIVSPATAFTVRGVNSVSDTLMRWSAAKDEEAAPITNAATRANLFMSMRGGCGRFIPEQDESAVIRAVRPASLKKQASGIGVRHQILTELHLTGGRLGSRLYILDWDVLPFAAI